MRGRGLRQHLQPDQGDLSYEVFGVLHGTGIGIGIGIGMIFQDTLTSLNSVYRVDWQVAELLHAQQELSRKAARARVLDLLDLVALPDPSRQIDPFPHKLSGGQRQRVMIAMAIALHPRLLIADEPTTALDATTQLQLLALLDRLRHEMGMAPLLISHDLPLISRLTDRVVVMHHGEKMKELPSTRLFDEGQSPYTRDLAGASIRLRDERHHTKGPLT